MTNPTLAELELLLEQAHTDYEFYECLLLIGFEDAYDGYRCSIEAKALIREAIEDARCEGI
jgi:hypothetical protein